MQGCFPVLVVKQGTCFGGVWYMYRERTEGMGTETARERESQSAVQRQTLTKLHQDQVWVSGSQVPQLLKTGTWKSWKEVAQGSVDTGQWAQN